MSARTPLRHRLAILLLSFELDEVFGFRRLLNAHIDHCLGCQIVISQQVALQHAVPVVEVPADLGERLLANLPALGPAPLVAPVPVIRSRPTAQKVAWGAAAAASVAVGIAVIRSRRRQLALA